MSQPTSSSAGAADAPLSMASFGYSSFSSGTSKTQRPRWASMTSPLLAAEPGPQELPSPSMAPLPGAAISTGSRRGAGSKQCPWQLVEVDLGAPMDRRLSCDRSTGRRSVTQSPLIGVLRSPASIRPLPSPALGPLHDPVQEDCARGSPKDEWTEDAWRQGADWWSERPWRGGGRGRGGRRRQGWREGRGRERGSEAEEEEEAPEEGGFDPRCFVGEWTDLVGHFVYVVPAQRNAGGCGRNVYLATLHRPGAPEKVFHISRDRGKKDWTCGNGVLVREETTPNLVSWRGPDGRINCWERRPPEGPVYFDAPPINQVALGMNYWGAAAVYKDWCYMEGGVQDAGEGGEFFFMLPEPATALESESPEASATGFNAAAMVFVPSASSATSVGPAMWPQATPQAVAAATVASPPTKKLLSSPKLGPRVELSEECPDIKVEGSVLTWTLPDSWGKLSRYPKDFHVSSPIFGVQRAPCMQLSFYPNGSKAAENGHCTIALTRGPDSAGIKFEFSVNGRSSGPKVCLGSRYLGDYQRPFGDAEESKNQRVVVSMDVKEVFGCD